MRGDRVGTPPLLPPRALSVVMQDKHEGFFVIKKILTFVSIFRVLSIGFERRRGKSLAFFVSVSNQTHRATVREAST